MSADGEVSNDNSNVLTALPTAQTIQPVRLPTNNVLLPTMWLISLGALLISDCANAMHWDHASG